MEYVRFRAKARIYSLVLFCLLTSALFSQGIETQSVSINTQLSDSCISNSFFNTIKVNVTVKNNTQHKVRINMMDFCSVQIMDSAGNLIDDVPPLYMTNCSQGAYLISCPRRNRFQGLFSNSNERVVAPEGELAFSIWYNFGLFVLGDNRTLLASINHDRVLIKQGHGKENSKELLINRMAFAICE